MKDTARAAHPRKHEQRPPACSTCGSPGWWNGWREVVRRCFGSTGHVEIHPGQRLHRAVCSKPDCSAPGWTVYPSGRYPDRRFDLDVAVKAVAAGVHGRDDDGQPLSWDAIGRRYVCSGRSVSRWTRWVAAITDIEALARTCARIDPDGMPVAARPEGVGVRARAGHALAVVDRFAALLEDRGVLPRGQAPSLVRVLDDQRLRHGVRFPLRSLSPPLSAAMSETRARGRGPPPLR